MLLRRLAPLALVLSASLLTACSSDVSSEDGAGDGDEQALFSGTPNEDIGQFFMIEHFGVVPDGYPDVHDMIRKKNLGALILWNPQQASGEVAGQMVTRYAKTSNDSGHPELFVAADQEERGTQRFKSQNGFTNLVEGDVLGRSVAKNNGDAHVCEVHGRITAREMAAAGLNMALGTVSDVFTKNSGTPGMFRTRAIDGSSPVVASCIKAMTQGYAAEGHVVFVTKHFPGLGNASGNTDVDPKVRTYSDTTDRMEQELAPYRAATASVNESGASPLFGAMISHASYKILDASESPATLSSPILKDLVRSAPSTTVHAGVDKTGAPASFAGLGLRGLTVSDAFWTWGAIKGLQPIERQRLMARAFLSGIDVLMIAKADFSGGWDYFQALYAGTLPSAEKDALVQAAHEESFEALLTKFKARVAESAARIKESKRKVGPVSSFIKPGVAPRTTSTELAAEYATLTQ